jgi:hypothetical protein
MTPEEALDAILMHAYEAASRGAFLEVERADEVLRGALRRLAEVERELEALRAREAALARRLRAVEEGRYRVLKLVLELERELKL